MSASDPKRTLEPALCLLWVRNRHWTSIGRCVHTRLRRPPLCLHSRQNVCCAHWRNSTTAHFEWRCAV